MNEVFKVLELITSLSSTLEFDEVLAQVTQTVTRLIKVGGCAIWQWDRSYNTLSLLADYTLSEMTFPPPKNRNETDIALYDLADYPALRRILQDGAPVIIYVTASPQPEKMLRRFLPGDNVLLIPMRYKEQVTGLMELYLAHGEGKFTGKKIQLCRGLADYAAVVIENARRFAILDAQREALRQLSIYLINSQEEERRRLSRELHDEFGQMLTALRVNLEVARRALPAQPPLSLSHNLQEANKIAIRIQEAVRSLSQVLRPAILDQLGLASALKWEVNNYKHRTGQIVHFQEALGATRLSPDLEIAIYRIISEALTNVARHAQATQVWVSLHLEKQHLIIISVEDDGLGFDADGWFESPLARRRLGLLGMQERAELLSGRLKVVSKPGRGVKIWAQFPLNGSSDA